MADMTQHEMVDAASLHRRPAAPAKKRPRRGTRACEV